MESEGAPQHHVFTHPSRVEHWRHFIEIVALIVAAIWGVYVFIYQERIKPANESPNVDFSLQVQHAQVGEGKEFVEVNPAWKNIGNAEAQLDGFVMNIYGHHYTSADRRMRDASPQSTSGISGPFQHERKQERTMKERETLLVTVWHPWRPLGGALYAFLLPGERVPAPQTFVVPQGEYDTISVEYLYCFRRRDDRRTVATRPALAKDGSYDRFALRDQERGSGNIAFCAQSAREFPI